MEATARLRIEIATNKLRCYEVAKRAGIHKNHLSLILNDHLRPRAGTLARIERAIRTLADERQQQAEVAR